MFENTESTQRQYALRQRAVALGWPLERIIVIDADLGQSGASAADRAGFQQLVAEVGLGRAGIVLGLEVSRLARNSTDWHRLLEICALTDTLILDEDGIYDPARLQRPLAARSEGDDERGGAARPAGTPARRHPQQGAPRRAALSAAGGLGVRRRPGSVVFDPDTQVQDSVRLLFATFARTGTLYATVRAFRSASFLASSSLRILFWNAS